jgi:hypothetical protein
VPRNQVVIGHAAARAGNLDEVDRCIETVGALAEQLGRSSGYVDASASSAAVVAHL